MSKNLFYILYPLNTPFLSNNLVVFFCLACIADDSGERQTFRQSESRHVVPHQHFRQHNRWLWPKYGSPPDHQSIATAELQRWIIAIGYVWTGRRTAVARSSQMGPNSLSILQPDSLSSSSRGSL